jgi:ribA/ribD-fused uncharacterized protein
MKNYNIDPEKSIDCFRGEWDFLSNFSAYPAFYEGIFYPTSEHAFQAAKTLDQDERIRIASTPSPSEAKKIGKSLKLRPNWELIKFDVMRQVVYDKFSRFSYIKQRLLETGDANLEEGNWWGDKTWGTVDGEGLNWLGKILMETREKLKDEKK